MNDEVDLFKWRKIVMSEFGPEDGMTRLVLIALSTWMDQRGSCWPSTRTIAAATRTSKTTICRHLIAAEKLGWLVRTKMSSKKSEGKTGWVQHSYKVNIPNVVPVAGTTTMNRVVPPEGTTSEQVVPLDGAELYHLVSGVVPFEAVVVPPGGTKVFNELLTENIQKEEAEILPPHFSVKDKNQNTTSTCPAEDILNLYRQTLPELGNVYQLTEKRRKILSDRWTENPERQNLAWWKGYFEYVRTCKFLLKPESAWCDLEWLTNAENLIKVIEGKYEILIETPAWKKKPDPNDMFRGAI